MPRPADWPSPAPLHHQFPGELVLPVNVGQPLITALIPANESYTKWSWTINGQEVPYGLFLGEIVNFLLISLILFIFIVKFLGWVMKAKKEEAAAAPPPLTKDQELLTEIRDLLKKGTAPAASE